ncbi:TPA: hypothetical protein ACVO3F_004667 [Vibrio diabolicus]
MKDLVRVLVLLCMITSCFWLGAAFDNDVVISFISMLMGILFYPVFKLDKLPCIGVKSIKHGIKDMPIWVGILLSGLFMFIPLTFQSELANFYVRYEERVKGSSFSIMGLSEWLNFIELTLLLFFGGLYLLLIYLSFQITVKKVVDSVFEN